MLARYAQANGQVERLNQIILPALQTSLSDIGGRNWNDDIRKIERDLNTAIWKTAGRMLFEMLHACTPRFDEGLAR